MKNNMPDLRSRTLKGVGRELLILSALAEKCQVTISELLMTKSVEKDPRLAQIQDIDLITQTLQALALFVDALSDFDPKNDEIFIKNALSAMPLRDVANRLTSSTEGQNHSDLAPERSSDQIEVF